MAVACRSSSSSLGLGNGLNCLNSGLGGRFSTDSLGNNGLHVHADLLGDTGADLVNDVLDDGGAGNAVLGDDLGDSGVSEVSESVVSEEDLGVGLGLPLAVVSVGESGDDGLDVIRGAIDTAALLLQPGGLVVIEHSDEQGGEAEAGVPALLLADGRWRDVIDHRDLARKPRFTTATRAFDAGPA